MLLLYGDKDDVVRPRNIENLSAKADQLGISVTTRRYEKLNHGSLLAAFSRPLRNNRPVVGDVISFLDANAGERH
jgi:acetyl esterase/lipase